MGSIAEFNRRAATGRQSAEKYCKEWAVEIDAKSKDLAEQLTAKKIDKKTYNLRRVTLNNETKDLNSCISKVNKTD